MERASNKAERLLQIEALLLAHRDGLPQSEVARRLGVNRSTIHRYLPDLTTRFAVYLTPDGRLAIDRDTYLAQVRFTLHEAMALHIAARLMAKQTDEQNPHAVAALRKLGIALERLAPAVSDHLKASADDMDAATQRHDPVYLTVFETLTRAWSDQRKVRIRYRSSSSENEHDYILSPYLIEPASQGAATHVIGYSSWFNTIRTYKLERILHADLTAERYTIPTDFDRAAVLRTAWGIWFGEKLVTVRLRFAASAIRRIQETRWHPDEQVELLPDGGCLYTVRVAHPDEMKPWIRSWGPQVTVESPTSLRDALAAEAQQLVKRYAEVGAEMAAKA
jgi:CRISPR-associated endonuclease/helicase Cas3